jgi:hypothetical protein
MMIKKNLLSIPQDGPAARSMNNKSSSRNPLDPIHPASPATGDTAVDAVNAYIETEE